MKPKRPRLATLKPRVQTANLSTARSMSSLPGYGRSDKARKVYESRRWREKVRPRKLAVDPLCQRCTHMGLVVAATDVDHWQSISRGGAEWDEANLVSLCHEHHSKKTRCEQLGQEFPACAPSTPRTFAIA